MTITEVNALTREQFIAELGAIFENSPWVADWAYQNRPFKSVERLHSAMIAALDRANREKKLALLRAHPDLGSKKPMSAASTAEQASVGIDSIDWFLQDALQRYRDKHGFPFIYAVQGSSLDDILLALSVRVDDTREREFRQALLEVEKIAMFRLQDKFKEA